MTLLIFLFAISASAKPTATEGPIPHFVPGKYHLTAGDQKLCGEGDFHLSPDKKVIWLGAHFSFSTHDGVERAKGGASDYDKGCEYQLTTKTNVQDKQTEMTATDVLQCGDYKKHEVIATALITDKKITFNQERKVDLRRSDIDGGSPRECVWELEQGKKKKR